MASEGSACDFVIIYTNVHFVDSASDCMNIYIDRLVPNESVQQSRTNDENMFWVIYEWSVVRFQAIFASITCLLSD